MELLGSTFDVLAAASSEVASSAPKAPSMLTTPPPPAGLPLSLGPRGSQLANLLSRQRNKQLPVSSLSLHGVSWSLISGEDFIFGTLFRRLYFCSIGEVSAGHYCSVHSGRGSLLGFLLLI